MVSIEPGRIRFTTIGPPTSRSVPTRTECFRFRRQGYTTYQQDQYIEPIIPLVGEDNILWGADYPHPDCIWPESRRHIEKNLGALPAHVRRKITCDNAVKLYHLR
jgi:uncharacterized protein